MKQTGIRFLLYGWAIALLWGLLWVLLTLGIGLFQSKWPMFLTLEYLFAGASAALGIFQIQRVLKRFNYDDHPVKVSLIVASHIAGIGLAFLVTLFFILAARDDWALQHDLFSIPILGPIGSAVVTLILTLSLAVYVAHLIVKKRLAVAK